MRWSLILLLFLSFACKPAQKQNEISAKSDGSNTLIIFALEEFRSSGLEATIVPDFEKEYSCRAELSLFSDPTELINALKSGEEAVDVVFGIPSVFAFADTLERFFQSYRPKTAENLNQASLMDDSYRLIPYGFSYLGLLYNSEILPDPPTSFGELQDDRFLNQLALIRPSSSGAGRTMLYLSLALFGGEGFEQMLRALRKNVFRSFSNQQEALASVNRGESSMMPGLITLAAWQAELQDGQSKLEFKLFSEGSFLHSEYIGITNTSKEYDLAGAFLDFVLRETSQKMIIYKLGLFPANSKTMLPQSFSKIPISPWLLNNKLSRNKAFELSDRSLEIWSRTLSGY